MLETAVFISNLILLFSFALNAFHQEFKDIIVMDQIMVAIFLYILSS